MTDQPPIVSTGQDNRQALRCPVRLQARLRDRGAKKFAIDLIDISLTGFRAETVTRLYAGNPVWLTLPGMESLEARVAWVDNAYCGCAFTRPLHPAVFERIVAMGK